MVDHLEFTVAFLVAFVVPELFNEGLDGSSSVNIQGSVDKVIVNLINYCGQDDWVSSLNNFLTKIISELVDNYLGQEWKDLLDQALVEGTILDLELFIIFLGDSLLKHSASNLIKTDKVQVIEDLFFFVIE